MTIFKNLLGTGLDTVKSIFDPVTTIPLLPLNPGVSQIRLTFTSSEVGNGSIRDSDTLANQDGGLAVRAQAEAPDGSLTGLTSRFSDEGVKFVSLNPNVTFDVRDLVSGAARGDGFHLVQLGTKKNDLIDAGGETKSYYINAGMGNDTIKGGTKNDFLVGGAGNDSITGGQGNDSFIGGGGDDVISGGEGNDTAIVNVATDGADRVDLGNGSDVVNVTATGQVRVTFTSAEVGNGLALDGGTLANQDGGLAVRLQGEDAAGALTGAVGRYDDEGITFVAAAPGVRFDVRDLVSGVARGDGFEVVQLGTSANDVIDQSAQSRSYYVNAGMGNDSVTGGSAADFLVGGAGNDVLAGNAGNDSLLGSGGADTFVFGPGPGNDVIVDFVSGTDKIDVRALGVTAANGIVSFGGGNTLIEVDTDLNGTIDFTLTLLNTTNLVFEDFIFA